MTKTTRADPKKIKSVSSAGKGAVTVTTYDGATYTVTAKDTGGVMPKPGEHISKYTA